MLEDILKSAREASRHASQLKEGTINEILLQLADTAEKSTAAILGENKKDLDRMPESDPRYDRLKLTPERIKGIASDLRNVAKLTTPLGLSLEKKTLPNGLQIEKLSVPLGVVGIIYEARPNVTFDVFSLCLKTGNVCLLKGGSDAAFSNAFIVRLIQQVLTQFNTDKNLVTLLPTDREATHELLNAMNYVDVIIPRGSQQLIDYVRQNSKVPVIETGAGIVHTYFDDSGDLQKGASIIFNSKTRRVSVCNALDCLIIHQKRLNDLPQLTERLKEKNVRIYADPSSFNILKGKYPDTLLEPSREEHFGTEFLDYKMSIKTVPHLQGALEHIHQYSSKHSEAIVAENENTIQEFLNHVDAAAVYANASTAFTDGAQFGLGAEIGISTQKLHARGPMALKEMTSYKWIIRGNGQIRE